MFDVLISPKEIENWVVKVLLKLFLNGTKYISELEQFKKLYSDVCFEWKPLDALSFKKHIFAHLISYQKKICQTLNLALQADFVVHFVAYLSLNCTTFMSAECTENCVAWNCSPSKWAEWKKKLFEYMRLYLTIEKQALWHCSMINYLPKFMGLVVFISVY